jgi:uncharacterized protein YcfJ
MLTRIYFVVFIIGGIIGALIGGTKNREIGWCIGCILGPFLLYILIGVFPTF